MSSLVPVPPPRLVTPDDTIPFRIKPGQHITTEGTVGSGKTFFNKNALLPAASRGILLDSEEDDYPEFPVCDVKHALKLAASDYSFFCRVPTVGDRVTDEAVLEELSMGVLAKGKELTFLIEEATDYSDASYIPPYFRSLIRRARHKRITVIISTQRPAMMSKDLYSLALHHVFFALSDFDVERTDYARFLREYESQIPYGSYRSVYQAPDKSVHLLAPVPKYDWASRLERMRP